MSHAAQVSQQRKKPHYDEVRAAIYDAVANTLVPGNNEMTLKQLRDNRHVARNLSEIEKSRINMNDGHYSKAINDYIDLRLLDPRVINISSKLAGNRFSFGLALKNLSLGSNQAEEVLSRIDANVTAALKGLGMDYSLDQSQAR